MRDALRRVVLTEYETRPERGSDWLEQELRAMHEEVNRFRMAAQLKLVSLEVIRQADEVATGSDWTLKFAEYRTDIAMNAVDQVLARRAVTANLPQIRLHPNRITAC